MTLAAYGVLWPGAFATDGALILMPKWGAAATLPLSIVLGWLLTLRLRAADEPHDPALRTQRSGAAPRQRRRDLNIFN